LVVIGGLAWFMSGDETSSTNTGTQNQIQSTEITESSSIQSDDEVFSEIDNAIDQLE